MVLEKRRTVKFQKCRILLALAITISVLPFSFTTASAHSFETDAFERTLARTDQPVADGRVNRTWMWGPSGHTNAFEEVYYDAPGSTRLVQYTDKSRMEDNSHNASSPPWDVTNGLLATELITGRVQLGDTEFQQMQPATVQIAGDSHPNSPTYATFNCVLEHDPLPTGSTITQTIDQHGNIGTNANLGQHGVTATEYVADTGHTVASVFWSFMNSSGEVYESGQFRHAPLFENPYFATGYPITEPYWMNVPVGGEWRDVLAQCFQRRCLTYTPGNPDGWQVEAGNIGQHYYQWRYGEQPPAPAPTPPVDPDPGDQQYVESVVELVLITDASFQEFDRLVMNVTGTEQWFEDFFTVMAVWMALHSALDSLDPPAAYQDFHNKLLDAYWVLGQSAEDFVTAFETGNEYYLDQAFQKLEEFIVLFEQAADLLPQDDPDWASFESLDSSFDSFDVHELMDDLVLPELSPAE
jgi:hypothetical protein